MATRNLPGYQLHRKRGGYDRESRPFLNKSSCALTKVPSVKGPKRDFRIANRAKLKSLSLSLSSKVNRF